MAKPKRQYSRFSTASSGVAEGASTISRAERFRDEIADGKRRLFLLYPHANRATQELNADFLLEFPSLKEPFRDALLEAFSASSPTSRVSAVGDLRVGFFSFLMDKGLQKVGVGDLTTALFNEFISWLDAPDSDGVVLTESTRSHRLSYLRVAFGWLRSSSKWGRLLDQSAFIRDQVWPGISRQSKPTAPIELDALIRIYMACVTEVAETMSLFYRGKKLIADCTPPEPALSDRDAYRDLGWCLKTLDCRYPGLIPHKEVLEKDNASLWYAIARDHGGLTTIRSFFYPSPRRLVPFVLLLAIHTKYNGATLTEMEQSDCQVLSRLGEKVWLANAFKAKSNSRQPAPLPVDDDLDNPATLTNFLRVWTARLRPHAPPVYASRLFLFVPEIKRTEIKGYGSAASNGGVSDIAWTYAFKNFRKDHKIPKLTYRQFRVTAVDLAHELTGDLRAAQTITNHVRLSTTAIHYGTDAQRQRNDEALGGIMLLRERHGHGPSNIDPRIRPARVDKGAATPGWTCMDPYSSPYAPKNRLCEAYGMCPGCPLATLDSTSPYSCAMAHLLLDALMAAQPKIDAKGWLRRFVPVVEKLKTYWLAQFSGAVRLEAKTMRLPPLPVPE